MTVAAKRNRTARFTLDRARAPEPLRPRRRFRFRLRRGIFFSSSFEIFGACRALRLGAEDFLLETHGRVIKTRSQGVLPDGRSTWTPTSFVVLSEACTPMDRDIPGPEVPRNCQLTRRRAKR